MTEIVFYNIRIKPHFRAAYLGCILEEIMFGELVDHKVMSKVNASLKFFHWKSNYLALNLRRLVYKAVNTTPF